MKPLDRLRRGVRLLSWALAIGTVAAVANAAAVVALIAAWPESPFLRAVAASLVQAAIVFALTWLAEFVVELDAVTGAVAGLWTAALPAVLVWAIDGMLGLEPQAGVRIAGALLAMAAGALASRVRVQRRTGSGPPSSPMG